MTRLINAEFKKIFHKKSFYIVTILFILYTILTNFIYKSIDDNMDVEEPINIAELESINKSLDLSNSEELDTYIYNLASIDIYNLKEKYHSSNATYLIENYLSPVLDEYYEALYRDKNEEKVKTLEQEINNIKEKIDQDDWKYFVNLRKESLTIDLNKARNDTEKSILKESLELVNYRIDNNISFDDENFLNNAILDIEMNLVEYNNLKKKENKTKTEESAFKNIEREYLTNKYILEHKENINNNETLKAVLTNFTGEFELFILIYIVMLCGSIVSEEFNKGTIKYLLTKPYKRRTILLSKLLTILILIPIVISFMVLSEIIIGGIILGFDTLDLPILVYKASTHSLVNFSCLKYLGLSLVYMAPMYLVLVVLCFALSTITTSTSAAITITFLFYLMSEVIASVGAHYLKILKYFVSVHWNFSYLLEFSKNAYKFKPLTSIIIVGIYIVIILCLTFIYFKKKDVKNI